MNSASCIILGVVAVFFVVAVIAWRRKGGCTCGKDKGGCSGCCCHCRK